MKPIELRPIKETTSDFEEIERRMKMVFRRTVYGPILKKFNLDASLIKNARKDSLESALATGKIVYSNGLFTGQFNAAISKKLKEMGAVWDKQESGFRLTLSKLPIKYQSVVLRAQQELQKRYEEVDTHLTKILPAEIAGQVKSADVFDKAILKNDKDIADTLKGLTIAPKLSDEDRIKIAKEWQENMDLWIKNFAESEIKDLRQKIQQNSFAGGRYQDLVKSIERSYNVTSNKAKFLARQETALLMAKFKETKYLKSGVYEYKWGCVKGTPSHPVRPDHRRLENQIFRWDNPPITNTKTNARNNPGQDYNCRCFAIPLVRAK